MTARVRAPIEVRHLPQRLTSGVVGAVDLAAAGNKRCGVKPGMCATARREPGRWLSARHLMSIVLTLLAVGIGGCADPGVSQAGAPRLTQAEESSAPVQVPMATAGGELAGGVGLSNSRSSGDLMSAKRSARPQDGTSNAAAYVVPSEAPTVEDLLAKGLHLAEASPAHLAVRGTPAASSVRCAWRGIARTAQQRSETIRYWFRLGPTDPIPDATELEVLFRVVLDEINPDFRETAKANFLAIARGGESMDYLFLTCFADYAVSHFLLGSGTTPATVTVAYDRRDEAASYELYVREHDTGTYGTDPLQTRGAYEAGLQAQVLAAEQALSDEIGGREAIVFLAPLGAHHAISFEAWQAVASWALVTDAANVVQAIRDDTPEGDPEHTQTLANLTSRITAGAAADGQSTNRATRVDQLQQEYRDLGAYADITPGDGQTTTFTPAQPPAAPTCTNGTVVANPAANRELVKDCEALLAAKDTLRGTATLNWATGTALSSWTGVTTGGRPTRVTGLSLPSQSLSGTIPPQLGHLFALTTLNLSSNSLTGDIPAELGWLDHLTELRLSGNTLTGCVPLALKSVTTNDLSSLNLPYCEPPAPANLRTGTATEASLPVLWDALTGASTYQVEVWVPDGRRWRSDSATITGTTHTVSGLQCETAYDLRVRAFGNGTTYGAVWGAPSAALTATTGACTPPSFVGAPYRFTVSELAAVATLVGTLTATDAEGSAVTYAITAGDEAGAFALDASSGALTIAATGLLDYETAPTHTLTVAASDAAGGTVTAQVTITLTDADMDYDADADGLIEVTTLAQLDAIRWDLDGDGTTTAAGYAAAFPDAPTGMGCPTTGCTGYELRADLDFDTDGSGVVDAVDAFWDAGAGWTPIGTGPTPFTATFDGGGHVVRHLRIARRATDDVGLFGGTGAAAVIRHVGLVAMDVTGGDATGGLVGANGGTLTGSFAVGQVTSAGNDVGGLVGANATTGRVTTSYAMVQVSGGDDAGGLVGANDGAITASYAQGAVTGATTGGLAGSNSGTLTASYASGAVSATTSTAGGLVGRGTGTVTTSYWDTTTSGQAGSTGGTGQTTSALQTPAGYTGIYARWDVDLDGDGTGDAPWHFGDATRYPALQVDFDGDGTASWPEFGEQRPNRAPVFGPVPALTVREDAPVGTAVGTLTATDADGDAVTYALSAGNEAGAFALDATSGVLTVAAAGILDYETAPTHDLTVAASDPSGARGTRPVTVTVSDVVVDYDADADGLIEVATLAQLDAIRWDLDGDGTSTDPGYATAFPEAPTGMGCPATGCAGYELVADLDFDTDGDGAVDADDAYWNAGQGWAPIGGALATHFDGNGHVIANLFVARGGTNAVGLFHEIGSTGEVAHVDLHEVQVTGAHYTGGLVGQNYGTVRDTSVRGAVAGTNFTGGLLGANFGTVRGSAVDGTVTGSNFTGGLVGQNDADATIASSAASARVAGRLRVGGLAGTNGGTITTSYASGSVTATNNEVGGLVGRDSSGTLRVSYATGAVTGVRRVGGLVGEATTSTLTATYATGAVTGTHELGGLVGKATRGTLRASYATGAVGTGTNSGGLVGQATSPTVTASYWDTTTSGQSGSAAGTGQTTSALQTPEGYTGLYAAWDVDLDGDDSNDAPWDFGTAEQYPVLKADINGDGDATWREFGAQRPNHAPVFADGDTTTRAVDENTAAGMAIGTPVAATDADADPLTYALGGRDAASFAVDPTTGQVQTLAPLDYETTRTYTVTLTVSDGRGGAATITVTIQVRDLVDQPPAPPNLAAGPATTTSVPLTWDAVSGATTYRVEYRPSATATWMTASATLTGTSHTVPSLTCGTAYEFRVSAYGDGTTHTAVWSAASAPLAAATSACVLEFDAAAYAFVVDATAGTGAAVGTVTATDPESGAIRYTITAGNAAGTFALDASRGQLTVAGTLDAARYDLTVQAGVGAGDTARTATAPVAVTVRVVPPAPQTLTVGTATETSVPLGWAAVSGAAAYRVEYRPSDTDTWTTADATLTTTSYTLADLSCATAYVVRVSAYGDGSTHTAAWGPASAEQPATTSACPLPAPAAPATLTVGTVTATSVPLSWAAVSGAATYRVEYRPSDTDTWTTASDTLTTTTYTLADLDCATAYVVRVSAYGDGSTAAAAWGPASAEQPATTGACPPTVWTATLTVATREFPSGMSIGYSRWPTPPLGALAPTQVDLAGTTNTVDFLFLHDGTLGLGLDKLFATGFVLSIGDAAFASADATLDTTGASYWFMWDNPGVSWATGDEVTVSLRLVEPDLPAPAAPATLTVGTVTATSVPLSWAAVSGAAAYRVEYRPSASDTWTVADATLTTPSYTLADLDCATAYVVRVSAYGDGSTATAAWGPASAEQPATTRACPLPAPTAPATLTVGTVTATSVPLSWTAVSGAAAYRVEYRPSDTDTWTVADATLTTTSHTVADLSCGTAYVFRVSAYGDGSTAAAAWGTASAEASATTSACPLPAPAAPATLTVGTVTATSVPLSWAAVSGAAAYRVEYRPSDTDTWTTADATLTTPSYTLADLDCATAYVVRVSAYGDGSTATAAWGPASAEQPATTSACPLPAPAPTNLTATVNTDGSITLSWAAPADATVTGYQILRRRPQAGETTLLIYVEDTGSPATTYTDTAVTAGTRHTYRVKAINPAGLSAWSNFAAADPP